MFALRHDTDGAFYTKNYTWNKFTDKNHTDTLSFETKAQAEEFTEKTFSGYQRKSIEIVDIGQIAMFALFNAGRYYTNNFTWIPVLDADPSAIMKFESEESAENFRNDIFTEHFRQHVKVVNTNDPIQPITVTIKNEPKTLPVVTKYLIANNGNGMFYGKMFTWTAELDYTTRFDTKEDARRVIKEILHNVPEDLLEIRELVIGKVEEKPNVIKEVPDVTRKQLAIFKAAIDLIATGWSEDKALDLSFKVWDAIEGEIHGG